MTAVYGLSLATPSLWEAGFSGPDPVYFDCERCGTHDGKTAPQKIAGFLSTSETYDHGAIVVKPHPSGSVVLALYCETCWPLELDRLRAELAEEVTA